jgi:hypothetical protein
VFDRHGAANNSLKVLRAHLRHAIDLWIIQVHQARNIRDFAFGLKRNAAAFQTEYKPVSRAHVALSPFLCAE